MVDNPYRLITESQRAFLSEPGVTFDQRGWAMDYRDNLFAPLHPDSLREFTERSEISVDGSGERISAPHSSTALAVNTFDWFRSHGFAPMAAALEIEVAEFVGYERRHSFGLPRPANLDVEFATVDGIAVGVEVKLREPYGHVSNPFADKYFTTTGLWDGLPNLERLARTIRTCDPPAFSTLHAAQLIKHALGLHRSYGDDFVLVYYWHYVPGPVSDRHKQELAMFEDVVRRDINFTSVTVEDLLGAFPRHGDWQPWLDYMTSRYLNPARR